jgi:copper chaperone CopZ
VSKSLGRLDVVRTVKTELDTQRSTLTFKPGKPVDFAALAKAVDQAGFKAGSITIWAKGTLGEERGGQFTFTVSGTSQTFPVADGPQLAKLKGDVGKEISLVANVRFEETPPRLIVGEEPAKGGMEGDGGMKGM